jgi:hypothetical protein
MGQNAPVGDPPVPPVPPVPPTPDPTPPPPAPLDNGALVQLQQANALLQARIDFPNADASILSQFQGTAEGLRGLAESLHKKESERLAAMSQHPGPAPTPGPGGSQTTADAERARYAELARKVQGRYADPLEIDEFGKMAYGALWNQHMIDRKNGGSSSTGAIKT